MQALILAAGRGSRLGRITEETHKCLLQVGRHSLIDHQLRALSEAGVGPVVIITGYCGDQIREAVGIRAEYINNPRWSSTNSLYSFFMARNWIKGPVVILNCDVLFHPKILHRMLSVKGDAIAYDSSSGKAPEHMKVRVVDGHLIDMSKDLDAGLTSGENVGILCFTEESVKLLTEKARTLLLSGSQKDWLGAAVREVARERKIHAVDIAGLPWIEIDSAQDLQTARRKVWTAIRDTRSHVFNLLKSFVLIVSLLLILALSILEIRTKGSEVAVSWEVVGLNSGQTINLMAGDRTQTWLEVENNPIVFKNIGGPGKIRIDTRLLLKEDIERPVPYVLSVEVDDNLIDWFKQNGKPSGTWKHSNWSVCKLKSVDIELPPGLHIVRIALTSMDNAPACAVRLRRAEPKDPD